MDHLTQSHYIWKLYSILILNSSLKRTLWRNESCIPDRLNFSMNDSKKGSLSFHLTFKANETIGKKVLYFNFYFKNYNKTKSYLTGFASVALDLWMVYLSCLPWDLTTYEKKSN